jgi:hypothetical protein
MEKENKGEHQFKQQTNMEMKQNKVLLLSTGAARHRVLRNKNVMNDTKMS